MTITELRQELNENVREWGNRKFFVPRNGGIGDLLAANLNFRRIGATLGGLAPYLGLCYYFSDGGEHPILGAMIGTTFYLCATPLNAIVSYACGLIGYEAGERIDSACGDTKTPRTYPHYDFLKFRAQRLREKAGEIDARAGDDERPLMVWHANSLRKRAERLQSRAREI